MLYYLFDFIESNYDIAGAGLFRFLTFRAVLATLLSLVLTILMGNYQITLLNRFELRENVRDLGLAGQKEKEGVPTMGGIIIILAVLIPTLLFAQIDNLYVIMLLGALLWMGAIGFIDDYQKVRNRDKKGLRGQVKVWGQIVLGILIGTALVISNRDLGASTHQGGLFQGDYDHLITTIPFVKDNEFRYEWLLPSSLDGLTPYVYILLVIFIIVSVSNGVNLSDGMDGMAAGLCSIMGLSLALMAYLSGNVVFSGYLNIMFIPNVGEVVVFCSAFVGACVGFLWYNSYPARVFMGDTGSLSLGAVIAVLALIIRKELLIPLLCGVLLIENLSVVLQVYYFRYTRKRTGTGKRIFLMSPLHHHYQKKGIHEAKVVTRFWTVGILLAILTLVTLKIR